MGIWQYHEPPPALNLPLWRVVLGQNIGGLVICQGKLTIIIICIVLDPAE